MTRPTTAPSSSRRGVLAALLVLGALLATLASADIYTITLQNGNTFLSKYEPIPASWDPNYILFMTDVGNIISLDRADVADITSETESRGFGTVIDTTTVLIGFAPNDMPTEEAALEALGALRSGGGAGALGASTPQLNTIQFSEPTAVGGAGSGGVPLGFAYGVGESYVVGAPAN